MEIQSKGLPAFGPLIYHTADARYAVQECRELVLLDFSPHGSQIQEEIGFLYHCLNIDSEPFPPIVERDRENLLYSWWNYLM